MERRKFLIGMGSAAAGASALVGSGAFSRVESHRQVTVQVANDANAYLGFKGIDGSPNSENFFDYDEQGHAYINIGELDDDEGSGVGVNSDSKTWFDGLFKICNQGKQDVDVSYKLPSVTKNGDGESAVKFYWVERDSDDNITERHIIEPSTDSETNSVPLVLGDCVEIGLRTNTKGVDASNSTAEDTETLIDGEVVVTAEGTEE